MDKGIYHARLINSAGQVLGKFQIDHNGMATLYKMDIGNNPANGIYRLEFTKPDHKKLVKAVLINN